MLLLHVWFHRQGHAQNLRNLSRLIHISVSITESDSSRLSISFHLSMTFINFASQQPSAINSLTKHPLHWPFAQANTSILDLTAALYGMYGKWMMDWASNTSQHSHSCVKQKGLKFDETDTLVHHLKHGESPIYSFSWCLYAIFGCRSCLKYKMNHSNIDAKQNSSAAKWVILSKLGPFEPTTLLDLHSTIPSLESRKFVLDKMSEMWRNYTVDESLWISLNTDLSSLSILNDHWKTKGSTIPSPSLASPSGICSRSLRRTTGVFLHLSMSVEALSSWP